MAESHEHFVALSDASTVLREWFTADPSVRVGACTFIYCDEMDPSARVKPDLFGIFDLPRTFRGSYRTWTHGGRVGVAIEFTSPSTWDQDMKEKLSIYQDRFAVSEYFLFDPRLEAAQEARLFGFRLIGEKFRPIPLSGDRMFSEQLGMDLVVRGVDLRFHHRATETWLMTLRELNRAQKMIERRTLAGLTWAYGVNEAAVQAVRANAEAGARAYAERQTVVERDRALAAEAEVERLREILRRSGGVGPESA